MPTYYVEDYEELTGLKPDGSPIEMGIETKVVVAPEKVEPKKTVAQTKASKAK